MKKIRGIGMLLFFMNFVFIVNAQFIPVVDPILASALCSKQPATMSGDCLNLDTVAAATVGGTLQLQYYGFSNVQELKYFKNIYFYQTVDNLTYDLPDFTGFPNLYGIDIRGNPWTNFSQLYPIKNQLQILLLRRVGSNNFVDDFSFLNDFPNLMSIQLTNFGATKIPDFSKFTGLTLINVTRNKLSFKDLLPLTALPNYSTYVVAMPQLNLSDDTSITAICNTRFKLTVPIDAGVEGISYEFYKDSILIQSSASNELNIEKIKEEDNGSYYVHIRSDHPFFATDFLTTGIYSLKVNSITNCNDLFSPNNDGIDDLLYLDGTGEAIVRNKIGQLIKKIKMPGFWDGTDSIGNKVDVGIYSISSTSGIQTVTLLR